MRKRISLGFLAGILFLAMIAYGVKAVWNAAPAADQPNSSMETSQTMAKETNLTDQTKMKDEAAMTDKTKMAGTPKKRNKGDLAPDFDLTDLNGNQVKLSDFRGQKVYIKYWASWCPICLGGLEDINTLSAEDNDFQVLTIVAPGQKGEKSRKDFETWFSGVDHTKNITVLFDTDGAYGAKAGVRGYPTSEYIGSDGVLVKLVPGHADNDTIKDTFQTIQ